jgi:phosphatidylserine/phosphatidylglycerophosphate/cardiolipin synthase-like enzyme
MSLKIGNVELYMGPKEAGAPDDLKDVIVKFIEGAQKRLDIAVQELDCKEIADAIIQARRRKVTVRIVLEQDYLKAKKARKYPYVPGGEHEINRELHDALLRTNINVRSDYNPKIFHQKFIIRDYCEVLTGSTNFTDTGVSSNLNHIVIIRDKEVAKIYSKEFKEIEQGHFGKLNEGHDPKPEEKMISNIRVKVLFAPDHNPEMEIMKQMLKAKDRIDFAIFTFSESSGIDDAMRSLSSAGKTIKGAFDGNQAGQEWAATHSLHEFIEMYKVPKQDPVGKLHHKLMVIDKQLVIAGSFNYTGPANLLNDENIIILGDLDTSDDNSIEGQKQLGKYAVDEIDRIINNFGIEIVP